MKLSMRVAPAWLVFALAACAAPGSEEGGAVGPVGAPDAESASEVEVLGVAVPNEPPAPLFPVFGCAGGPGGATAGLLLVALFVFRARCAGASSRRSG